MFEKEKKKKVKSSMTEDLNSLEHLLFSTKEKILSNSKPRPEESPGLEL